MRDIRKLYVNGRYGQIHLRFPISISDTDEGALPLICLHQSPKSGLEFERIMLEIAKTRQVFAPDYPGYGNSDAPPTEADATIEMYAEEMWQVVDTLGFERVDLFGNHTGGKVAVEMARQRPDGVGGIAMLSAAILTDEEREQFRNLFTPIPLDESGTRFKTMWERIVEHRGPGMTLEMMSESLRMNLMGGEAYEWGHVAAFNYGLPFEDALKTLPHRITILNPHDMLKETTRRAADIMINGEVIECPEWAQGCMDAFPESVAQLVLEKLDAA